MLSSTCATVPRNTSTTDRPSKVTVSCSEASGLRILFTEAHNPAGRVGVGRGAVFTGAVALMDDHSWAKRTDLSRASNAARWDSTASAGPVILKNQVAPPRAQIAPTP